MNQSHSPCQTVLVVEDNATNMELVTVLLEVAGLAVLQAPNAESGIALAIAGRPDLILMDVGLPGMDGLSATELLQSDPRTKDIPIVVVTAHAMLGDEAKALNAGCVGYITKPIQTRTFAGHIKELLTSLQGKTRPE